MNNFPMSMISILVQVLICMAGVAMGVPQSRSYGAPPPTTPQSSYTQPPPVVCPTGQVDRGDGTCVKPTVTRNLFLFNAPASEVSYGPAPELPDPRVFYNFVFIRTADEAERPDPIVAPAAQQKTLVYLLSKKQGAKTQEVIQVESNPTQPDVYFVNYKDGQNVDLPGGIDLQTALSQSVENGEVIEGGSDGSYSLPAPAPAPSAFYSNN